ncbi:MAG: hypothetical protein JW814_07735 [Candidatus Krumholzibacteriota bacterium]|nr:hypothetical protein [Candidatus Krumholzibacteriota bacterium]
MNGDIYPGRPQILILGACAVTAQAVFLRELLGLFHGTEFTIGFLLASWLFWIAAGGLLGGRMTARITDRESLTRILSIAAGSLLPLTVILIRLSRGPLQEARGEFPGYFKALTFSFFIIAPFTFLYGWIYNTASLLFRKKFADMRESITSVYRSEAAGSVAGALLFSFVLIGRFSQLEASFIIFMTVLVSSFVRFRPGWKLPAVIAAGAILCAAILPALAIIDESSISAVFPGYQLRGFISSKYAELVAVEREDMLSVYAGGGRIFSIPEPERIEEAVDIPLLCHDDPRDVLIIGSLSEGVVNEASKHPSVKSIDLMELDEGVSRLVEGIDRTVPGGPGVYRLEGLKIDRVFGDPRALLFSSKKKYDLIIVSVPAPVNILWNRFYTREFFLSARKALAAGGIFDISHPSSENYISGRQCVVLGILKKTLEEVFGDVGMIPGSTAHFIAGAVPGRIGERLLGNLHDRKLDASYVNEAYLPSRLSPERFDALEASLGSCPEAGVNSDLHPVLPYHEMILEAERKSSGAADILEMLARVPGFLYAALIFTAISSLIFMTRKRAIDRTAIFITGFTGFLLQMTIMTLFQIISGVLYHGLILLSAFFMAGISLGSSGKSMAGKRPASSVRKLHIGFLLTTGVLFALLTGRAGQGMISLAGPIVFYAASFAGGILTGSYYRTVVSLSYDEEKRSVPAVYYSTDLLGATLGGLTGGFFLLPVAGVLSTLVLIAAIHLFAAITIRIGR